MEVFGLPAHVLVVHAAVVLTPLAVLATIAFAVLPRWRYLTRWPAVVLAALTTATLWAARITGDQFLHDRFASLPADNPLHDAIHDHQQLGQTLSLVSIVMLVLVVVAARLLSGPSGLASGRGAVERGAAWVDTTLAVLLVLVALVVLVYVVLTGDAGARAVWNPPQS